jgi:FkbM family methyltransferase
VAFSAGDSVVRQLRAAPRQLVELLPATVGLPVRAWKNYPRVHGLSAPARALCGLVPPGRNAVDAGANRGVYAYWIAKRAKHLYAFEPLPEPSSYLRRAKVANITVFDVALSDTDGEGILRVPATDGEASLGSHVNADHTTSIRVPLARLDDFHLADIGFLKIDVEGHELQVLQGGDETIRESRPILFIEVEQRYQTDPISTIFDHITGSLSYDFGYFWERGRLLPFAEFQVERHQLATTGDRSGAYINNFVFSDSPLT